MSLFEDFIQWEIIKNPKGRVSYKKSLKQKKQKEEVKTWAEMRKEAKENMSSEEYMKWLQKESYKRRKEKIAKKYQENKLEKEAYIEEIYKEIYDTIPDPPNYDKIYAEKFDKDDRDSWGKYRYYWRCSRLNYIKVSTLSKIKYPIKVYDRNFAHLTSNLNRMQDRAYEYLKPYIKGLDIKDFKLSKKQFFTKAPMRNTWEKMRWIINATDISNNQLCSVASAMLRNKYIVTELYLWRVGFLVGDVIITQNWNVIRPLLENNIPWLTVDTVEELHQKRIDYLKKKTDDLEIYALWDCYLIKVQPNERETYFYITPT